MKIVENSPDQLIMDQTPWILGTLVTIVSLGVIGTILVLLYHRQWLAAAFISGVSVLVVPTAFMLLVERTQIIVNDTGLTLRTSNLIRNKQVTIPLAELQQIDLQSFRKAGETVTTHRPVASHDGGPTALRRGYSSNDSAAYIADTINTWLRAHRGG